MGCGRVGSTLARSLEDRNHTVSVIDSEPDAFRRLGPGFNGDKVTGYGFDQAVLEKAGIRRADAFAAVSSGDNSNIIAARVARETFGIQPGRGPDLRPRPRRGLPAARHHDGRHGQVDRRPGAAPDAARRRRARLPRPVRHDPSRPAAVPDAWVGQRTVHFQEQSRSRIAWIDRLGEGMLPNRETVLQEGDMLHLVIREENAAHAYQFINEGPEE